MADSGFGGSGFNIGRSRVGCRYLRFLGGSVFGDCHDYGIEGLLAIAAPHQMCQSPSATLQVTTQSLQKTHAHPNLHQLHYLNQPPSHTNTHSTQKITCLSCKLMTLPHPANKSMRHTPYNPHPSPILHSLSPSPQMLLSHPTSPHLYPKAEHAQELKHILFLANQPAPMPSKTVIRLHCHANSAIIRSALLPNILSPPNPPALMPPKTKTQCRRQANSASIKSAFLPIIPSAPMPPKTRTKTQHRRHANTSSATEMTEDSTS